MSDLVLTMGEDGKLHGLDEADERSLQRFRAHSASMRPGDTIRMAWHIPRSQAFHNRHFAILSRLFDNQEQFDNLERFREWVQVGAGFCDLLPGPSGRMVAVSRSIRWDRLEQVEFEKHHREVMAFVRSRAFWSFLWPHLSDERAIACIDGLLAEFEAPSVKRMTARKAKAIA